MEFDQHYHEVLDFLEDLLVYIFTGLKERFAKETAIVRAEYPVEEFKLPKDGKVLRFTFAEATKFLREAGHEAPEYEDLRFVSDCILI